MFTSETKELLHKSLPALPVTVCGGSLKHDLDDLVAGILPPMRLAVIDDHHTAEAFGDEVFRALKSRFACEHITLGKTVMADDDTVALLQRRSFHCDALIAVGSGTVNDLCKYASFLDEKPYLIFPTAASMNGYVSANASITREGVKTTLPAHMPRAVFCDLSILTDAPERLSKSGLGDSLARPTAQADWLLSHILLDTAYDERPFALLAGVEPQLFDQARGIAMRNKASIELLMQTLLLSGFGMTIAGGSYPASQGEHMIAHGYEMMRHAEPPPYSLHGEQIGVTALSMAGRQEAILRQPPKLLAAHFDHKMMQHLFGEHTVQEAAQSYQAKCERIEQASPEKKWEEAVRRISAIAMPSEQLHAILQAAKAPDTLQAIGWQAASYEAAFTHARFLRDRFGFLDMQP